jgi:hypothetical protein
VTCNGGATRWWPPPSPSRRARASSALGEIDHDGKRTLIVMGRRDARSHCGVTRNAPPHPPSDEGGPKTVTRNGPPLPPSTPLRKYL